MRIAHLSDLHYASWDWNISQVFSKRWLGNLNFLFGRRNHFDHKRLEQLPLLLKSLYVFTVIITGDLSTTSSPAELVTAKKFISEIEAQGIEVLCIPGNHDHYTKEAYQKRHFYNHFSSCWGTADLKEEGVTAKQLSPGWWIIGLDTALATSWFHSTGYFNLKTEQTLDHLLQNLPSEDQVLLVNHFPFFQHESPRKRLVRGPALQKLIEKYPQIKIYCHGHTHRRCIAPLKSSGLPLILDPGSTPHRKNGGWHLIDLKEKSVAIQYYEWSTTWTPSAERNYDLV
ncbi:MAG: metallophosphoesterase family protein [Rhabdochlamydiaceae bacterium]